MSTEVAAIPAATRARALKRDTTLAAAENEAREAALATSGLGDVGEYLGYVDEAERLGSHRFASTAAGYRGWYWNVTVARIARSRHVTVCEVELLPGDEALLAPAWVPWSERLRPKDVGPGDVLPADVTDDRVVPGYLPVEGDGSGVATDAAALIELGAWRDLVPSRETLQEAAVRWEGNLPVAGGAFTEDASAFIVPLSGYLGQVYGVCVNEFSPLDGQVVRLDQVARVRRDDGERPGIWKASSPVLDELDLEVTPSPAPAEDVPASAGPESSDERADDGAASVARAGAAADGADEVAEAPEGAGEATEA